MSMLGKHHSDETKKKIGATNAIRRLGRKASDETKMKMSLIRKGKKLTEEHKRKIGLANKGRLPHNTGRSRPLWVREKISRSLTGHPGASKGERRSDETRKKISLKMKERKPLGLWPYCPRPESFRMKLWRGGPKMTGVRVYSRRKKLKSIQLNDPFDGSDAHHIDTEHVIFIPREIHKSIAHSHKDPESLEKINTKAYCWLLGVT